MPPVAPQEFIPAVERAEAVRYTDPAQASDLAAWCGGRVVDLPGTAAVRRVVAVPAADGQVVNAALGSWVVRRWDGFSVMDDAAFSRKWRATA